MELKTMSSEQLEERLSEIRGLLDSPEADLDSLDAEVRSINEELETRSQEQEKRSAILDKISEGEGKSVETFEAEERKESVMDIKEFRNTDKYIDLYAEAVKSGDDSELRAALLSENVEGDVAVPTFVEEGVRTAWERDEIMRYVPKLDGIGNYKVNFELSASDAVVHTEGGDPVDEETLTLGTVEIKPEYIKKWKGVSKQVLGFRGRRFLDYLYDEIGYRVIKKAASRLIGQIAGLPQTANASSPSAGAITAAPALGVVAQLEGLITGEAGSKVLIMNPQTKSAFKAAVYQGSFYADPFEGYDVITTDALPAYSAAASGAVYAILGDLRNGTIATAPNGDGIEYTFDPYTQKKANIVEILGEWFLGTGVVADKHFALLKKA